MTPSGRAGATARRIRGVALIGALLALLIVTACGGGPEGTPDTSSAPVPTGTDPTGTSGCSTTSWLATWSDERLAAQVLTMPVLVEDLSAARENVRGGVGSIILFGSRTPSDLTEQIAGLQDLAADGVPLLVMVDEEGGAVQRLADVVGRVPSARQMAATMTDEQIRQRGAQLGRALRALGVTVDLAPVLDLDDGPGPNAANPAGTRSFGTDPVVVSAQSLAFAEGLSSAGVMPVVKHFPGLGGATGNTDNRSARTLPWQDLRATGLIPFQRAIQARTPAVMVSNAVIPGLTTRPASVDPTAITTVLRGQLGFTGLVVTDSLSARALADAGYSPARATVAALAAGADLILLGGGGKQDPRLIPTAIEAVVEAVEKGRLPRERLIEAAGAVLAAKHVDRCH
jgi:beta-N-acetylhexosaminidase